MLMPSIFGEDLFDDFMGYPTGRQAAANAYPQVKDMMKTDFRDVDGNYELEIDLPGFTKGEIKVEEKNGYLPVSASKALEQDSKEKESGRYIHRERYTGACQRSFYIGEDIENEQIKAEFKHGILKLTLPKKQAKPEVEEKRYISIEG